ncbi:MAG: hypothetical protein IMZ62_12330 [Chloroflexi bacterium]|nr:hypothetical protein [Chloroflexota bacterium]
MNRLERVLTGLYVYLLRLFPHLFRSEFESEMQRVFAQTVRSVGTAPGSLWKRKIGMIRLFLREVVDFPAAVWNALRFRPAQEAAGSDLLDGVGCADPETPGRQGDQHWIGEPSTWGEALLGAVPFILYGLAYFVVAFNERPGFHNPALEVYARYASQAVYIVSVVGLAAGCVKGFPSWSYAYLGMVLYAALNIFNTNLSMILLGRRAWILAAAAVLIALLVAHSLRPVGQLFLGIWQDWSRVALAFYAALVPIYTVIFLDGDWGTFELAGLGFDTLLLAAGAIVFLRSRTLWQRVAALQAAMFFLSCKGMLLAGWNTWLTLFLFVSFWGGLMLIPLLFGLLRRGAGFLLSR